MTITIDQKQKLYVIQGSGRGRWADRGYSCLGFDVLLERYARMAGELGRAPLAEEKRGTLEAYEAYSALLEEVRASGRRLECELSPQLKGLEGARVEVTDRDGETRRFWVGKSTGHIPIHLEVATSRSHGGRACDREYKSVRVVRR